MNQILLTALSSGEATALIILFIICGIAFIAACNYFGEYKELDVSGTLIEIEFREFQGPSMDSTTVNLEVHCWAQIEKEDHEKTFISVSVELFRKLKEEANIGRKILFHCIEKEWSKRLYGSSYELLSA